MNFDFITLPTESNRARVRVVKCIGSVNFSVILQRVTNYIKPFKNYALIECLEMKS